MEAPRCPVKKKRESTLQLEHGSLSTKNALRDVQSTIHCQCRKWQSLTTQCTPRQAFCEENPTRGGPAHQSSRHRVRSANLTISEDALQSGVATTSGTPADCTVLNQTTCGAMYASHCKSFFSPSRARHDSSDGRSMHLTASLTTGSIIPAVTSGRV